MSLTFKEWRLAKGISQEEMALACEVCTNTYARWERTPETISVKYIKPIADRLGVAVDEVIFLPTVPTK